MSREDKVYRAEFAALMWGGPFISVEDAAAYCKWVMRTKWWRDRCSVRQVEVTYGAGRWCTSQIVGGVGKLHLLPARLCQQFVNHELAHLVAPATGHGPLFVTALVGLTKLTMGTWLEQRLKHALEGEGIRIPEV